MTAWHTPPFARQLPKVRHPWDRAQSASLATTHWPAFIVHRPAALQSADAAHWAEEPAVQLPGLPLHRPCRLHSAVWAQGPLGLAGPDSSGPTLAGLAVPFGLGAGLGAGATFGGGSGAGGGAGAATGLVTGDGVTGSGGAAHPMAPEAVTRDDTPQKIAAGDRMASSTHPIGGGQAIRRRSSRRRGLGEAAWRSATPR